MHGLRGSLLLLPLGDLFDLLSRRKLTGTLTCERGTVRKTLLVRGGAAVGASSNDPREYLGQLLLNFGHIDEEQLQKAFQTQEETKVKLGRVLTMVGLISKQTVTEVLAIKIRETALDAFRWDSGLFFFDYELPAGHDDLDAEVPLGDIAKEAEFRATAWNAFRGEFPTGTSSLVVEEQRVTADLGPATLDGRLLALARRGLTIDEIGLALHATDFHLYQRLYALARRGVLRAAPEPTEVASAIEEAVETAALLEQGEALLGQGRVAEAELAASRAVASAPSSEAARALLRRAEGALRQKLQADLTDPPRVPALRLRTDQLAALTLSSADRYLLSRCDGRRTVRQLVQIAPLAELEVLKALRRFADAGVIRLDALG